MSTNPSQSPPDAASAQRADFGAGPMPWAQEKMDQVLEKDDGLPGEQAQQIDPVLFEPGIVTPA